MRILLVHNKYQLPGGEDGVFEAEKLLLSIMGHEVKEIIFSNDIIKRQSKIRSAAETFWSFTSYRKIRDIVRKFDPQIVHFHNNFPLISSSGYFAARSSGAAIVHTLHNYRLICPAATLFRSGKVCEACTSKTFLWPAILYRCYRDSLPASVVSALNIGFNHAFRIPIRNVDAFVTLTDFARNKFVAAGFPAENLYTKPNFLFPDPNIRPKSPKNQYGLFIGRISYEKGLHKLIEAWSLLDRPKSTLHIVGDGPAAAPLKSLSDEDAGIEWFGWRDTPFTRRKLLEAKFIVLPSQWYEGFPMVLLEALSAGVPIIASRIGGIPSIIKDKKSGLLFNPDSAQDLSETIAWAYRNPRALERIALEGRRLYDEKFSSEKNYDRLMEIYREAIQKRKNLP